MLGELRVKTIAQTNDSLLTLVIGGLAQLARAPALHAGGHRFDSDILHQVIPGDNYFKWLSPSINEKSEHK